ncbi:thioredoxin-dependent thiol peroxidase [Calothrix sp. 336/3]|uniref:thioredoxin-dependent thiol peroxidase n=1 Tax=Calothrix sp. 336/3 TaxID=1337936 RepID=UPI000559553C|nr:thioredoxin-dependent thiol peroxidase [Calothrix sp. 336/3]AKG23636.1 peroxiredoxin [Calothrix sp. 336/3]
MLQVGQKAPSFSITNQNGSLVSLEDFVSQWLVIYFYPKDDTPGCTTEAKDFTEYSQDFRDLGANILGISPDSEKSHCKFIDKHDLKIQLLSDSQHQVCELYDVWGLKKFMGKEYMGVIRSTFLVNPQQEIIYIWSNVKTKGHALAVLNKLKECK